MSNCEELSNNISNLNTLMNNVNDTLSKETNSSERAKLQQTMNEYKAQLAPLQTEFNSKCPPPSCETVKYWTINLSNITTSACEKQPKTCCEYECNINVANKKITLLDTTITELIAFKASMEQIALSQNKNCTHTNPPDSTDDIYNNLKSIVASIGNSTYYSTVTDPVILLSYDPGTGCNCDDPNNKIIPNVTRITNFKLKKPNIPTLRIGGTTINDPLSNTGLAKIETNIVETKGPTAKRTKVCALQAFVDAIFADIKKQIQDKLDTLNKLLSDEKIKKDKLETDYKTFQNDFTISSINNLRQEILDAIMNSASLVPLKNGSFMYTYTPNSSNPSATITKVETKNSTETSIATLVGDHNEDYSICTLAKIEAKNPPAPKGQNACGKPPRTGWLYPYSYSGSWVLRESAKGAIYNSLSPLARKKYFPNGLPDSPSSFGALSVSKCIGSDQ